MGRSTLATLLLACCACGPSPVLADDVRVEAAALVGELGRAAFDVREAATRRLTEIGEPALPALRVAAREHEQFEVRRRAGRLVERILRDALRSESTGMTFAFVEEGMFTMGAPKAERGDSDNERDHRVAITRPYLLGHFEVTQREYAEVVGENRSWFSPDALGAEKVKGIDTDRLPADSVTWFDAVSYCNALSKRDGLPPYYRIANALAKDGHVGKADVAVLGGTGYRLPTEAEWEYACRAGTTTPYHFGKTGAGGNFVYMSQAAYGRSSTRRLGRPTVVGSYKPNAWGLYDMHGNVGEWCGDWYGADYYAASPAADPRGPATGVHRVQRGGNWMVTAKSCRSASRFWSVPGDGTYLYGFRVARTAPADLIDGRPEND